MAKFGTSSSVGMLAIVGNGDGVDVGTRDGPCASRWDGNGLTSVGGGDGVSATSEDLTSIDTVNGNEVDNGRLSLGGSSLTTYHFFPTCPFPKSKISWTLGGKVSNVRIMAVLREVFLDRIR